MVSLNNWRFEANFILNYRSPTLTTVCNSYLKEKFWYLSLIKWWSSHLPHVTLTFVAFWLRFQPLAPIWICMMALTLLASHTESRSRVPLSLSHSCQVHMVVLWREDQEAYSPANEKHTCFTLSQVYSMLKLVSVTFGTEEK